MRSPQNSGQIGLLNIDTGVQTQIQASSPSAAPMGVTFAPDNSLWSTEFNASDLRCFYLNPNGQIVRHQPAVDGPLFGSLAALRSDSARPTLASLRLADRFRVLLVKKEDKGKHGGKEKKPKIDKRSAKKESLKVVVASNTTPPKKKHDVKKGRWG